MVTYKFVHWYWFLCTFYRALQKEQEKPQRQVSFWYYPHDSDDIAQTFALLEANPSIVSRMFLNCGHHVTPDGLLGDNKVSAGLCLGRQGVINRLHGMGIAVELMISFSDKGPTNIAGMRKFFDRADDDSNNSTTNSLKTVASAVRNFNADGVNFDLEPHHSTAKDNVSYAAYLTKLKKEFRDGLAVEMQRQIRVTACVARWSPMLWGYSLLAEATDRLLDMGTYHAGSMEGWLKGDGYGGGYEKFFSQAGRGKAGIGLGGYPKKCGKNGNGDFCWSTREESGRERVKRMLQDGVEEVGVFRLFPRAHYPQKWWWKVLEEFVVGHGVAGGQQEAGVDDQQAEMEDKDTKEEEETEKEIFT